MSLEAVLKEWPVTIDIEYDEDGVGLLCNYPVDLIARGGRCHRRIWGDTWGEMAENLAAHIWVSHPEQVRP
jgi:hypothetical protein